MRPTSVSPAHRLTGLRMAKGTFKVFGVDDEQGYLDKYAIAESIEDGTTVPLNYALAPSGLQVDSETLGEREFLQACGGGRRERRGGAERHP